MLEERKIRILQIYDSIAVSSGISNVIISWMRNIDLSKVHMDVLACWKKTPSFEEEIKKYNGKIYYIEDREGIHSFWNFVKKIDTFFCEHAKYYDIVHLHSSIFSYPILSAAYKYGIKIRIVHVHSAALGNTRLSALRNKVMLFPMKRFANHFWACSEEAAAIWYKSIGIKNYLIVNNGIETGKYYRNSETRKQYRKLWGIGDNTILIGHISNMSPIKNVPFLIETAKKLVEKGYNLKLVLLGKSELPDDVRKSISLYKMSDYIINAGVRKDIYSCVQAFDVCFMPSKSEGYGLVPIEVQTAEVPVVISMGFPEVISSLPLSFSTNINSEEWVELFERIVRDYDVIRKDSYDRSIYDKFDIKFISETVINEYRRYLGEAENDI